MKELSIEEKAKRYDLAIEKAKSKIKNDKDHVLYEDDVIEIFPELKESEDERIRKVLIKAFEDMCWETWRGIKRGKILNWLEKQGQVKDSAISQHENKTCKENGNSLTSEDERIRKAIIECVKNYGPSSANPKMFKNMLAWLEAQCKNNMGINFN